MRWRARTDHRLRTLRALPELAHLSGSDLRGLLAHFDEVTIPGGTVVARAGQLCHQYVVVLDGLLETCTRAGLRTLPGGGSCGWDAMRERGMSPATVVAASEARLLVMGRAGFRAVPIPPREHARDGDAAARERPLAV